MATNPGREAWRTMSELFFFGEGPRRMHEACAELGLSPGLLKGLLHLAGSTGVPMRDLADDFGCDASYVTTLADGLEERGLVERRPHPTDRRVKELVLTPAGLAAQTQALARLHEPPPALHVLTTSEQRVLRDLLRKVADAAAEHPTPSPEPPATARGARAPRPAGGARAAR